jgi:hypothetical protein
LSFAPSFCTIFPVRFGGFFWGFVAAGYPAALRGTQEATLSFPSIKFFQAQARAFY